jgi:serine protease inhibitor
VSEIINGEGKLSRTVAAILFQIASTSAQRKKAKPDHPFIFLIHDTRSGSLLFLG